MAGNEHNPTSDSSRGSPAENRVQPGPRTPDKSNCIGLLLEDFLQPAWACASVERLLRDTDVSVALVVLAPPRLDVLQHRDSRLRQIVEHGLVTAFERLDERLLGKAPDPFDVHDLKPLLMGIPTMTTDLHHSDEGWHLSPKDVETISGAGLDALLYLGEEVAFSGDIRSAATHGVWLFRHGSPPPYPGTRSGYWETLARDLTATSALVAVTEEGDRDLWTSVMGVRYVSPSRTRAALYWSSASFPQRALKSMREGAQQTAHVREMTAHERHLRQDKPTENANRRLIRCLPRFLSGAGRESMKAVLGNHQWFLAYTWGDEGIVPDLENCGRIVPPRDRYWADPHVVMQGDQYFVFVEEVLFSHKRGRIAVIVLDESGLIEGPMTVLERPYHLSYPFVFEHGGELYMIPESSGHGTIELYRCEQFPLRWEYVRDLMQDVFALDTTVLHQAGKWWLFTCIREREGAAVHTELFLFSSDDPIRGSWSAHAHNPIVCDARRARPAGAVFERDGRLLRPSQQAVPRYGYAVRINEILAMTDREYLESDVACLLPDWEPGLAGTHTLSRAGDLTIVDACRWRSRFA